jgi:SAM-dependent methyltransferase
MSGGDRVFDRIAQRYDTLASRHGHTAQASDYGDPRSQAAKFRVLAGVGELAGRRVLDVGCGPGDFALFLQEHAGAVDYAGIDLSAAAVAMGREAHPDLDLRQANVLDPDVEAADVVFANGIFYLLGEDAEAMMQRLVTRMYELARQAVAFNSLSAWAADREPAEFHADPLRTLEFCRGLTPWVTLRHDYHSRDFTIYMYRDRQ